MQIGAPPLRVTNRRRRNIEIIVSSLTALRSVNCRPARARVRTQSKLAAKRSWKANFPIASRRLLRLRELRHAAHMNVRAVSDSDRFGRGYAFQSC